MLYHYKKPGWWTWTRHVTDSLEADVAAGRIGADWRIRRDGESTDYLPRDLLAAEAAGRAMSEIVYLKTACQRCGRRFEYPSQLAGQSRECPHCHQATPLPSPETSAKLTKSAISGWLTAFAILNFLAAVPGALLLEDRDTRGLGAIILAAGISAGFVCLAMAKIIDCLHESSQRLERIEKLLENR